MQVEIHSHHSLEKGAVMDRYAFSIYHMHGGCGYSNYHVWLLTPKSLSNQKWLCFGGVCWPSIGENEDEA